MEAPTASVRERLKSDLVGLEAEISRLRHGMVDLGKLLRDFHRSFCTLHQRMKAARRATGKRERADFLRV
jgi:hypothetical protein